MATLMWCCLGPTCTVFPAADHAADLFVDRVAFAEQCCEFDQRHIESWNHGAESDVSTAAEIVVRSREGVGAECAECADLS
jgi:hypothetical protein